MLSMQNRTHANASVQTIKNLKERLNNLKKAEPKSWFSSWILPSRKHKIEEIERDIKEIETASQDDIVLEVNSDQVLAISNNEAVAEICIPEIMSCETNTSNPNVKAPGSFFTKGELLNRTDDKSFLSFPLNTSSLAVTYFGQNNNTNLIEIDSPCAQKQMAACLLGQNNEAVESGSLYVDFANISNIGWLFDYKNLPYSCLSTLGNFSAIVNEFCLPSPSNVHPKNHGNFVLWGIVVTGFVLLSGCAIYFCKRKKENTLPTHINTPPAPDSAKRTPPRTRRESAASLLNPNKTPIAPPPLENWATGSPTPGMSHILASLTTSPNVDDSSYQKLKEGNPHDSQHDLSNPTTRTPQATD